MTLNRKAMVLAVGSALAAPGAYAQIKSPAGTDWEFYGKFWPEYNHIRGESASPVGTTVSTLSAAAAGTSGLINRNEMLVGNSYIGFRGSKALGSGMKAIWQVEQVVPFDEGGTATIDTGTLATRDSFLGVDAQWGTLRLGFMDTPFKKAGDVLGFLGVSSGNFVQTNPVLRQVGFATAGGGPNRASRFHERRGNAFDYASPSFYGVQYLLQYSTGNPSDTSHTATRNPRFVSMPVKWDTGPCYAPAMH